MQRGLARIEESTDAMLELINQLLDVTRQQMDGHLELHRQQVDLLALVRGCVDAQREASGRVITLEADLPDLLAYLDSARITRVVGNLLSNALKYSAGDRPILVRLARDVGTSGPEALIAVTDQGIGIPATDLPHIFDRFRRASNVVGQVQGTGIGLASALGIVEQHGGTITAESAEARAQPSPCDCLWRSSPSGLLRPAGHCVRQQLLVVRAHLVRDRHGQEPAQLLGA